MINYVLKFIFLNVYFNFRQNKNSNLPEFSFDSKSFFEKGRVSGQKGWAERSREFVLEVFRLEMKIRDDLRN